tara:strand:- start:1077 stop:1622 length:546 start_codon:yes stop_codon:yes gene_type:complete
MKEGTKLALNKATKHLDSLNIKDDDLQIIKALFEFTYKEKDILHSIIGSRKRDLVEANAAISNIIRNHFNFPIVLIGKIIGKHYSTIIHYQKLNDGCLSHDKNYLKLIRKLNMMVDNYKRSYNEVKFDYNSLTEERELLVEKLMRDISSLKVINSSLKNEVHNLKEKLSNEEKDTLCHSTL